MSDTSLDSNEIDITLMVACYNEQGGIADTLDTLLAALHEVGVSYEILVMDDCSTDRSVEIVNDYIAKHPEEPIRLVVNESNRGLAQNYVEGAFLGTGKYYRLVCGDNVEPQETLATAFRHIGAAEAVLFYPVEIVGRPLGRKVLSTAYTRLMNTISGHRLNYYNGCAILTRYHVMRWHTNYHGFGFQADLLTRLLDAGVGYVEVPVVHVDRSDGKSKALTVINSLSVAHTIMDIAIRRVGRFVRR